jgi:hypothetical protein
VADEGMVRYIRERLGEGYKEAEIRAALQGHGHPDTVIDDAFSMIHKSQKSNPLLIVLVLLILIMIGVIAFLVLQEEEAPASSGKHDSDSPSSPHPKVSLKSRQT